MGPIGDVLLNTLPQWSPPSKGGGIRGAIGGPKLPILPQWSPPVLGGNSADRGGPVPVGYKPNGARRS